MWDDVHTATSSHLEMLDLADAIHNGFPEVPANMPKTTGQCTKITTSSLKLMGMSYTKIVWSSQYPFETMPHTKESWWCIQKRKDHSSYFLPGIRFQWARSACIACNQMALSKSCIPSNQFNQPVYTSQVQCIDYISNSGHQCLVAVNSYSNTPVVEQMQMASKAWSQPYVVICHFLHQQWSN